MSQQTPMPPRSAHHSAPRSAKNKKKGVRWGTIIFSILGIIIILLAGYVSYLYFGVYKKNINKIADQDPTATPVPKEHRADVKPVSLVLLGLDYRKQLGSMNTDVIMVAAFNPNTKTATVVSIPRDSDLKLEGYKRHKVNAYYANFLAQARKQGLEDEAAKDYARDHVREMLSKFFDVPIDYTAVIDFQGFVDVVDALGGINVDIDKDMRYVDNADGTNIDLKAGPNQKLDGEDALGFVRYRKSNRGTAESSDFERNKRQSQVLSAMVDKVKSFGTITKIDDLMNAVGDNMRTDIPKSQIDAMISTYFGISGSDINFIPLEGKWISPYVVLDEGKLAEAKRALADELSTEGRKAETPAASPASSSK